MKIYVASSWRNETQPEVVRDLRDFGHEVYDFRNPRPGDTGFRWSEIDPNWRQWTPEHYRKGLEHDIAKAGFQSDFEAMHWADAFVLVQPCGRSAHLELGWACGAGKLTVILLADGEPELMNKLADYVCVDMEEVLNVLAGEQATLTSNPRPTAGGQASPVSEGSDT